jgi:HAD superfamily hydrolase (TIGR01509 family)
MNAVLIETFGTDFPLEACRNRANELYLASITQQGVQVKPGLWELLDFLGQESIATAVATSTPRELTTYHLNQTRLISRFKAIVTGDEIQHGKPAPDIFLSAATAINVSPDKCVVLEDSFPGIQAAHAAKMIPIMVPDLKPPTEEIKAMAYAIVPSLYEAKEVIAGLLNEETESQLR